jgi:hypothetical protein
MVAVTTAVDKARPFGSVHFDRPGKYLGDVESSLHIRKP